MVSTKIGRVLRRPFGPGAIHDQWLGGLEFQTVFDYGYDGVMRSFEDSLQRLGINSVDVLLIHDLDPWDHNPPALDAYFGQLKTGGWKALSELREAGVIKGIGAGFNSRESIPRYLDLFDIDFFLVAMRYTLLEQEVLESEFPRCAERGVGIIIGGGYNSGILATGAVPGAMYNYEPAGPAILERVAKMEAVCRRHNVPLAAAALQFPLGHPIVASVIPGAITATQVERNLAAFRFPSPRICGRSSSTRSSSAPTRRRRGEQPCHRRPSRARAQPQIIDASAPPTLDPRFRGDDIDLVMPAHAGIQSRWLRRPMSDEVGIAPAPYSAAGPSTAAAPPAALACAMALATVAIVGAPPSCIVSTAVEGTMTMVALLRFRPS